MHTNKTSYTLIDRERKNYRHVQLEEPKLCGYVDSYWSNLLSFSLSLLSRYLWPMNVIPGKQSWYASFVFFSLSPFAFCCLWKRFSFWKPTLSVLCRLSTQFSLVHFLFLHHISHQLHDFYMLTMMPLCFYYDTKISRWLSPLQTYNVE